LGWAGIAFAVWVCNKPLSGDEHPSECGSAERHQKQEIGDLEKLTTGVLRAETAYQACIAYQRLFRAKDARKSLELLELNSHDGIAFRAAWEELATKEPGQRNGERVALDPVAVGSFTGFVKGRLSGSLQKPFRGLFPRDFTHN
jgi:hypothetical protein